MNRKSDNSITRLTCFGIIEIRGADAIDFCHAQFTSDVKNMKPDQRRFSAWCNPKGQVIANFLLIRLKERLLLFMPAEMVETVSRRLQMFVLRSAVIITDLTPSYRSAGIGGETITDQLSPLPVPENGYITEYNSTVITRLPEDPGSRMLVIEPGNDKNPLIDRIATDMSEVAPDRWRADDIRAGLPWITAATREQALPQELNLDLIGALEYDKGCFPGQEVIARVHFRNRLKRRLYLATLDSNEAPQAGTRIYTDEKSGLAGMVINVTREENDKVLLLSVLSIELAASSTLFPETHEKIPLQLQPLPYYRRSG